MQSTKDPRRSLSSGLEDLQRGTKASQNARAKGQSINRSLINLGKAGKWKEILKLYHEEKQLFNPVNCSTMLAQLAQITQMRTDDRLFEEFLDDVSSTIQKHGIAWLGTTPRELATVVHAIAKLKLPLKVNQSAMKIVSFMGEEKTATWLFENGNTHDVSNCIWACGKLGVKVPNLFRLFEERCEWFFENAAPQNFAHSVWAFGSLGIKSPNLFRLLDEGVEWLFDNGRTQDVASCAWACGKLEIKSPNLFSLLDQRAEWMFDNGNTQDIANCMWACGKLGIKSPNLFSMLDQRGEWLFNNWTPQSVTNCIWACGSLGIESPNLFRLLDQHSSWLLENGNTHEVANCIWACGTLGVQSPNLFRSLEQHIEWLFESGNSQDVANCAWACGTLGIQSPKLFRLLDEHGAWLLDNARPQEVTNCVWACGKLGYKAFTLFRSFDQHGEWFFENGNSQDVANTVWALATLGIKPPNVFRLLDQHGERLFKNGNPQVVANSVWACGTLGIESPNVIRLLHEYGARVVEKGTLQAISMCAWTLAVFGTPSPSFFSAMEARLDKFSHSSAQNLITLCYAICVLDVSLLRQRVLLVKLWNILMERAVGELPVEDLKQMRYTKAFASMYGVELASPSSDLQRKIDRVVFSTKSSGFEEKISQALLNIGFPHQREFSPFESVPGLLSIDIACPDRMIAIECDGPTHFLSSVHDAEKKQENGPTKAKRRLLQQLGWNVINLSLVEARQHQMLDEWVRDKLLEAGVNCSNS